MSKAIFSKSLTIVEAGVNSINLYIPPGPSGLPCSSQFFRDSSFVSLLKKTQASTYSSVTEKNTVVYC